MNDVIEHIIDIKAKVSGLDEKCEGICKRLDISNGKLSNHEKEIDELKEKNAYTKGMHTIIISAIGVGITLITNFIIKRF